MTTKPQKKEKPPVPVNQRSLLTYDDAADYLSISKRKLQELIESDALVPCRKFGPPRIRRRDLDRMIEAD